MLLQLVLSFLLCLHCTFAQNTSLSPTSRTLATVATGPSKPLSIDDGPNAPSTSGLSSAASAKNNLYKPSLVQMDPNWVISAIPRKREYWWHMRTAPGAPDGYKRQMFLINNQFPGPLIEANEGDEIVIHVTNHLDMGQTIHWHGMNQNSSQWMDGVPGVSQCTISPHGGQFTYRFKAEAQFGSYWYHSHFANTLADGLVGGLIIHSVDDPLKKGQDFDEEMIVYVQDWMDVDSETIVHALHNGGFDGSVGPPQGDAILINGRGQTNCTKSLSRKNSTCKDVANPVISVSVGKKIRIRFLNTGSHDMYRISIDNHDFEIVETDDTPVFGPSVHELDIAPGQRYSVIVSTDKGVEGSTFWMRVRMAEACGGKTKSQLAVFQYGHGRPKTPATLAWTDLANSTAPCLDMDQLYSLKPRERGYIPDHALQTHVLSSSFGRFVDADGKAFFGFGFNNITYLNQINLPLLSEIEKGNNINSSLISHVQFDEIGGGDLVINNLDRGITHPYHLHGRPFWIVARGIGKMDAEGAKSLALPENPVERDTLVIPGGNYAVIRILSDNPGVWPLHCHIGWHLSQGKMAAVIVQPKAITRFKRPREWIQLCRGKDEDEFGPAKRTSIGSRDAIERQARTTRSRRHH